MENAGAHVFCFVIIYRKGKLNHNISKRAGFICSVERGKLFELFINICNIFIMNSVSNERDALKIALIPPKIAVNCVSLLQIHTVIYS